MLFLRVWLMRVPSFPGDVYVHADLHGATSCVIKNPSGTVCVAGAGTPGSLGHCEQAVSALHV